MPINYNSAGQPLCSRTTARGGTCTQPVRVAGEACFAHRDAAFSDAPEDSLVEAFGESVSAAEVAEEAIRETPWNSNLETQEEALVTALVAGQPSILWGLPGTGKTSFLYGLAESMGYPMQPTGGSVVINAAQRDPTDFIGLPFVVDYEPPPGVDPDKVGYNQATDEVPPKWALELNAKGGLLFIDEINTAPPSVQKALLSVVQERRVGSMHLGDNVLVVMAANPPDSMNGNIPLDPAMANRLCHIDWEPSMRRFTTALLSGSFPNINPPNPRQNADNYRAAQQNERAILAAFLEGGGGGGALVNMPSSDSEAERGWPSPRSWMGLANVLASATVMHTSGAAKDRIIKGMVGEGVGRAYQTYRRNLNLPKPQDIIDGKFDITRLTGADGGDRLLASSLALVGYIMDSVRDKAVPTAEKQRRWGRYLDVMGVVAEKNKGDVAVRSLKRAFKSLNEEDSTFYAALTDGGAASVKKLSEVLRKAGANIQDLRNDA